MEQGARVLSIIERPLASILGSSAVIQALRRTIRQVANSDKPVLVTGPTGSGKELVVRAIHELGPAASAPLFDVNCGAFSESLVEAQLFGHERGAFTGADSSRVGYFDAVGAGTLFFDEIAELALPLQAKLLRVLEQRRFRAVGSLEERTFSGRVIAATHADLAVRVEEKRFREDLFHRLDVLEVRVPGLEDRREDIPLLAEAFADSQSRPLHFGECAMVYLRGRRWPGNVRELRNLIDRAAVLCDSETLTARDLERVDRLSASANSGAASNVVCADRRADAATARLDRLAEEMLAMEVGNKLEAVERALLCAALTACEGNKTAAARLLGVHRKVIERAIEKYGTRA